MIMLDTSVLIDALTGPRRSEAELRHAIESGERIIVSSLAMYEWLRGPRCPEELAAQEALFPSRAAAGFGPEEAALAAQLYAAVRNPRRREMDLAIAACTILYDAALWSLNPRDFRDIPGLRIYSQGE